MVDLKHILYVYKMVKKQVDSDIPFFSFTSLSVFTWYSKAKLWLNSKHKYHDSWLHLDSLHLLKLIFNILHIQNIAQGLRGWECYRSLNLCCL